MKYLFTILKNIYFKGAGTHENIINIPHKIAKTETELFLKTNDITNKIFNNQIQGHFRYNSDIKSLFKCRPIGLRIEIEEIDQTYTKIILRFCLSIKFRLLFWGITSFLLISEYLLVVGVEHEILPENIIYLSGFILILSLGIAFCQLFTKSYSDFIQSYWRCLKTVSKKHGIKYSENIQKADATFPDVILILIIHAISHPVIFFSSTSYLFTDLLYLLIQIPLLFIIVIMLLILFALLFGMIIYPAFKEKLFFALFGIVLNISAILFLNLFSHIPESFDYKKTGSYSAMNDKIINSYIELIKSNDKTNMELEAISNLKFYAIMNLALRFVFLIFALFFLSVAFNLSTRFSEVIKLYHKRFDKNSIFYIALDNNKFKTLFSYCLFAVWILGNIALVYGILNFLSLIEIIFLNKNYIFSFIKADTFYFSIRNGLIFIFYPLFSVNIIELFFKMIVLLYVSICFMIIFYLMKYRAKHDKESNLNYPKTIIDPIISELATKLNINCPSIVYINSPNIKAEAKVLGFFRLNKIIKISSATVNKLNNLQLKGILAHEMYHIKYHGMKWNLLKKLSEYSLFGSGFLVNIISPYDIEFKADEFALNYLREYNGSIQVFESALLNIARTNQAFEGTDNDGNGLFMYQSKGNNNQTNSRINQFIELFVSEKISSYIHPTIRHRIENLKRYELNYLR